MNPLPSAGCDKEQKKKASDYPVMKSRCSTCPFRTDKRGRHPDPKLVSSIMQRAMSQGSHLCHHPRSSNKQTETHLCRGARDFQLQVFHRLGLLEAPTDAAWQKQLEKSEAS